MGRAWQIQKAQPWARQAREAENQSCSRFWREFINQVKLVLNLVICRYLFYDENSMISEIYVSKIKEILQKHLNLNEKVFVFGSSVENEKFGDVDLAIVSEQAVDDKILRHVREDLEESTLPYKFDLVDINQTNDPFRTRVLNGPKLWII